MSSVIVKPHFTILREATTNTSKILEFCIIKIKYYHSCNNRHE